MAWLNLLVRLRSTGMPAEQMARYAELVRTGAGTEAERLAILAEHLPTTPSRWRRSTVRWSWG